MSKKPLSTEPVEETWVEEVPSSQARARWNTLLKRIQQRGGEVRITRYGQVVARLLPADPPGGRPSFVGSLAGSVAYEGDLISPVDLAWEAVGKGEDDHHPERSGLTGDGPGRG